VFLPCWLDFRKKDVQTITRNPKVIWEEAASLEHLYTLHCATPLPPKLPLIGPYLIHSSLGPPIPTPHSAARLPQLFLHNTCLLPVHRQTDRTNTEI